MQRGNAVVALALGALLLTASLSAGDRVLSDPPSTESSETGSAAAPEDSLTQGIAEMQSKLKKQPKDDELWAQLGAAYVEQARVSADPSYYPKADQALQTSLDLRPESEGNDDALTAMGALANARHEFSDAADYAQRAQHINPADSTSWGVLADARIQLGEYDRATEATQTMLDLRPGLPSYSRASYDLELHGQRERATQTMELGLTNAYSAADIAFCRYHLGLLEFNSGDLDGAEEHFSTGLQAAPDDPTLLSGMARVHAARGEQADAVDAYERVVAARPLPQYLIEFGTYLESLGRDAQAQEQFDVVSATQQLFEAGGVQDYLTSAQVEAERGDPEKAVSYARQERDLRENIDSADALAWALHVAGRDEKALPYAEEATSLDGANATFLYHRGMIQAELGLDDEARASLRAAVDTNPYFSPVHGPIAQRTLAELDGQE